MSQPSTEGGPDPETLLNTNRTLHHLVALHIPTIYTYSVGLKTVFMITSKHGDQSKALSVRAV